MTGTVAAENDIQVVSFLTQYLTRSPGDVKLSDRYGFFDVKTAMRVSSFPQCYLTGTKSPGTIRALFHARLFSYYKLRPFNLRGSINGGKEGNQYKLV